ncbi:MAG TPA: sigma-70 family RNA polymerase sigma factor [Nitriliruptorales bacterium]
MATETLDRAMVDLVERAKTGDVEAFASLYDRYVDQVYGYIYRRVGHRQTAEDLCGDVFLRALRNLSGFQWQGVDLGAWLVTIARNRVHDHFKSARFRLESSTDEFPDHTQPTDSRPDDPERVSMARDMARSLGQALDQLKDDHREVIELRFVHGLSVAETAEVMDRTAGAIKALQYRAMRSLADLIKAEPSLANLAGLGTAALIVLLGGLR